MLRKGKASFERRVFPRFQVEVPIMYERKSREPQMAQTGNISRGGLLLYLDEEVQPGERLRVRLHLTSSQTESTIDAVGKVVWVAPVVEGVQGPFRAGFVFEEISPEQLKHLRRFEAIWLQQIS